MTRRAAAGLGAGPLLTREESEALGRRILGLVSAPTAQVRLVSRANGTTEFARGDTHIALETTGMTVMLTVDFGGGRRCYATGTRLDDPGLKTLVTEGEAAARARDPQMPQIVEDISVTQQYPAPPKLFFDGVLQAMVPEARAALVRGAIEATEAAGLISAGDLEFWTSSLAIMNTGGFFTYERKTYGQFSLTARTSDGRGSGWAWAGREDWARVDVSGVVARAVDLAHRSAKPVAIEPGRYTVILEPAAVAALVGEITPWWPAEYADVGGSVFSKEPLGTNKIGLQMMDRRLHMVSDPWDHEIPRSPVTGDGNPPLKRVAWFEHGVLTNLSYWTAYARQKGREPLMPQVQARFFADGPTQTLEEMIASTRRGLWVNRLSGITRMNQRALLLTGTTRDGTFLIENGKITKAIRNFRFTESPFFVFNKLEAAGEPVRASTDVVCPRLKVRDFDFTSLTDAI